MHETPCLCGGALAAKTPAGQKDCQRILALVCGRIYPPGFIRGLRTLYPTTRLLSQSEPGTHGAGLWLLLLFSAGGSGTLPSPPPDAWAEGAGHFYHSPSAPLSFDCVSLLPRHASVRGAATVGCQPGWEKPDTAITATPPFSLTSGLPSSLSLLPSSAAL